MELALAKVSKTDPTPQYAGPNLSTGNYHKDDAVAGSSNYKKTTLPWHIFRNLLASVPNNAYGYT